MFNENDIIARLQKGETLDSIVSEMTTAINNANKQYEDQKAKEKAAAEQKELHKKADLKTIIDELSRWLKKYYGIETAEIAVEDVVELIESFKDYADSIKEFLDVLNVPDAANVAVSVKPSAKSNVKIVNTDTDDVINQFLKNMGW